MKHDTHINGYDYIQYVDLGMEILSILKSIKLSIVLIHSFELSHKSMINETNIV